jgi:hypothetical protein
MTALPRFDQFEGAQPRLFQRAGRRPKWISARWRVPVTTENVAP